MVRRYIRAIGIATSILVMLGSFSACAGNKGNNPGATTAPAATQKATTAAATPTSAPRTVKYLSMWAEDNENTKLIADLTKDFAKDHAGFKLDVEVVPSTNLVQKLKTYIASDDVPDLFATGGFIPDLVKTGALLKIDDAFQKQGIMNIFDTGALNFNIKNAGGSGLYTLPMGMNIEGIWYNKKIFADNGISVPATWDDFMAACDKLKKAGIQPLVVGGKDRWPLTRYINMYVMRTMGVDALANAREGKISFTDPGFIKAGQVVQDMVTKGYFEEGVNTVDLATSATMFLTGKSAMIYNGSWFVSDLNNKEKNTLGENGVGFFNFPTVAGGTGAANEYLVNTGNGLGISKKKYDALNSEWIQYVFTKIGTKAFKEYGSLKGYKFDATGVTVPPYTQLINTELAKISKSGTWFEFQFDDKTTQLILNNGQLFFLKQLTPQDFFSQIQTSYAEYKKSQQ